MEVGGQWSALYSLWTWCITFWTLNEWEECSIKYVIQLQRWAVPNSESDSGRLHFSPLESELELVYFWQVFFFRYCSPCVDHMSLFSYIFHLINGQTFNCTEVTRMPIRVNKFTWTTENHCDKLKNYQTSPWTGTEICWDQWLSRGDGQHEMLVKAKISDQNKFNWRQECADCCHFGNLLAKYRCPLEDVGDLVQRFKVC